MTMSQSRQRDESSSPRRKMPAADPSLREVQERFVALWGQMGSSWGIPRTMAEVHALLFVAGHPMNTDEVMSALQISRGNASMTLRALLDWGIVSRVHRRGDRKEYFQAEQDVWKLFRTILRERKKREIDPLLEELHACRAATDLVDKHKIGPTSDETEAFNARLDRMLEFMSLVDAISQRFISPSGEGLETAAKLLAKAS
jgi:DNA-binding transcriptional regulator GbsR (MarR family)